MIHPLKVSTSFECDGCGHHASFHKMANYADSAVEKNWKVEEDRALERSALTEVTNVRAEEAGRQRPRQRQIEAGPSNGDDILRILKVTAPEGDGYDESRLLESLVPRRATKRKRTGGR
ncbi:MAG: hypothetical protein Q9172_005807 [Xanthocarpia lactea]